MLSKGVFGRTNQNPKYLHVVGADNIAKRCDVQLGRIKDGLRVIEKGLQPGDQVVINGIPSVQSRALSKRNSPMLRCPSI